LKRSIPQATLQAELKPGPVTEWALESLDVAQRRVYPASLKRGEAPDAAYQEMGTAIAIKRAALSGYRLAAMLQDVLGP